MDKTATLDLAAYYKGLSRNEKREILLKVQNRCGMGYSTARAKLTGLLRFSKLEYAEVRRIILGDEAGTGNEEEETL